MSTFWSLWVIVITTITLVFVFWTLWTNSKNYTGIEEGESMGHEFDGIEELNNPLPKWWTIMYWITGVWGVLYLILYPGMGNYEGVLGWKSSNQDIRSIADSKEATEQGFAEGLQVQYDVEVKKSNEKFGPLFQSYASKDIDALMQDEKALEIGQRLYLQNCSQCHGSDARGATGFPNLTDDDWLYGGEFAHIKTTLLNGRKAAMPAWIDAFGEQGIKDMTAYVLSLSGRDVNVASAKAGEAKFGVCAACHGADGKGNIAFGAPNLTDNIWLYGGSERAVAETLTHGRNGVMPAWKDILGEDKVHLISAYVYSLSNEK
ncbi:cytochrome-c oxidase, cbb3-type subunit III [Catenovulum sp. SM1970]|uniref:cytochrome-c oxidase, cbb3-type subunit III n=1 Tax=Marinifaba aquimaris TaxID=2741323 RepID=UPI001573D2AF|nr:cytochrome-c oxidase, cbb3-type subunit III [Marinifaba aquimaris]NTS77307.1 cytochrome-c oxidase, cbb3-type subunit III [Marinifaba aquimaris]